MRNCRPVMQLKITTAQPFQHLRGMHQFSDAEWLRNLSPHTHIWRDPSSVATGTRSVIKFCKE